MCKGGSSCCSPRDGKEKEFRFEGKLELPNRHRRCTDVACLLFFFLFWLGCFAIIVVNQHLAGSQAGGLSRLIRGIQVDGKVSRGVRASSSCFFFWPWSGLSPAQAAIGETAADLDIQLIPPALLHTTLVCAALINLTMAKVCGLPEPQGPGVEYNKQWFYGLESLGTEMLCVKKCPGNNQDEKADAPKKAGSNRPARTCCRMSLPSLTPNENSNVTVWRDFCRDNPMAPTKVLAKGVINICAPAPNVTAHLLGAAKSAAEHNTKHQIADPQTVMTSLSESWWVYVIAIPLSVVLSILFILGIMCGGRVVVYVFIAIILLAFIALGTGGYLMYAVGEPANCLVDGEKTTYGNKLGLNVSCTCKVPGQHWDGNDLPAEGLLVVREVFATFDVPKTGLKTKAETQKFLQSALQRYQPREGVSPPNMKQISGPPQPSCVTVEGTLYLVGGIIFWIIGGVLLIILIFIRRAIRLAASLLMESANILRAIKTMLLIPLYKYAMIVVVVGVWALVLIFIMSSSPLYDSGTAEGLDKEGRSYRVQSRSVALQWGYLAYHLFALLWSIQVVTASCHFIIGVCVTSWYFGKIDDKGNRELQFTWPIARAIHMVFRYHLGSLALGAFLVALVQFIRLIVEYIERKTKNANSGPLKALICMCKCCLWCLECCMKFISRQAYLMMAITGANFCNSAMKMFHFTIRNIAKVGALQGVGGVVMFFGKLFCVASSVVVCYFIIAENEELQEAGVEPLMPCLVCALISLVVSNVILAV